MLIPFELCGAICQERLTAAAYGPALDLFFGTYSPLLQPTALTVLGMLMIAFLSQTVAFRHLPAHSKGAAEYARRESIISNTAEGIISQANDQLGLAGFTLKWLEIYNAIIKRAERETSKDKQFLLYMAAVEVANKVDDARRSIDTLKHVLIFKPTDLVANFWLARAYERIGSAKEAIRAYETALMDTSITSEDLKAFLASQVQRVRIHGPDRGPALSTFKYEMW